MKILHLDTNHPILINQLKTLGFENDEDYDSSKELIAAKIHKYDGIIIRSRFKIDSAFLNKAKKLKFIGRVGAGLENIDCEHAEKNGVVLIAAPEGNRNAVGEHTLGLLLALLNNLHVGDAEIRQGKWLREANRGVELDGKTVGILGYGNMGKAFAKKLNGFDIDVICFDINDYVGDKNARQVSFEEFLEKTDILSLHTPQTPLTLGIINTAFINQFKKPFWFLNTARGKSVVTKDLVEALESGKILGAGLDVLEYEKSSFENMFKSTDNSSGIENLPAAFAYLLKAPNVILSPHVAGWSKESQVKLAETIVDKIKAKFC